MNLIIGVRNHFEHCNHVRPRTKRSFVFVLFVVASRWLSFHFVCLAKVRSATRNDLKKKKIRELTLLRPDLTWSRWTEVTGLAKERILFTAPRCSVRSKQVGGHFIRIRLKNSEKVFSFLDIFLAV